MIPNTSFWAQMRFYRSLMTRAQRRRTRLRRPNGILYPRQLEKQYAKFISNSTRAFILSTMPVIKPYLLQYAVRQDAVDDELETLLAKLESELEVYYGGTYLASVNIGEVLYTYAEALFGKHSTFFQNEIKVLTGGNGIALDTSWWYEAKNFWQQENLRLIKSLSQEYINKLNNIIVTGIQSGMSYTDLLAQIEGLAEGLTGFRARRLARDQIGKLNGVIAKYQQTSLGMQTYYWHTMGDEKVRGDPTGKYPRAIPQHFYIDGMLCSWDNPSTYSDDLGVTWKPKPASWVQTHPGFEVQCRCLAYGSWGLYLASIDREL
jgi:hypothetical protein